MGPKLLPHINKIYSRNPSLSILTPLQSLGSPLFPHSITGHRYPISDIQQDLVHRLLDAVARDSVSSCSGPWSSGVNRAYCYYDEVWSSLEDFQHEDEVIVNRYVGLQKPNFVFSRTRDFCRIASNSLAFMACNPTDFIIRGGWCQLPASLDGFMFAIENPQDGEGLNLINSRDFQDAE
ncbi:hypothetical protein WN943_006173 [Citrus x changshan-huyou]